MSTDRDVNRIVRSWLEEGVTTLPDRVLDGVLDQVPATPQRRSWWPARRFPLMSNTLRIALAGLAVVAVAIAGIGVLATGSGGNPTPTFAPTPTPAATPTPASTPPGLPLEGAIDPGTYVLRWLPGATITVTVPSGWYAFPGARGISQQTDTPRELGFSLWGVVGVYTDACRSEGTLVEVGPSVADLVKALVDQEGSDASVPADVTFGGFPAKRIDLTVPLELEGATCRIGDGLQIGANMAETDFFALPFGFSSTVYVIDVDGQRLVITTGTGDASSVEDVAEMQAMLDSIRIEP